jgi:hypothetical protein
MLLTQRASFVLCDWTVNPNHTSFTIYELCSKSSQHLCINQLCISHVRCCLSDLATWQLCKPFFFEVDRTFCLVFITGFVVECVVVVVFSMDSVKEQRICAKFCFRVGNTAAETHNMSCESYSVVLSLMTTYAWFRLFKNERSSMDDDEWCGFQLQDLNLWLPRWKTLSMEIVDWLTKKLQKRLEYPLVHATQF